MKDITITKALEAEKKFLSDEQARYIYNMREKARMDEGSRIATAEARGRQVGRQEGRQVGKIEVARDMLSDGMDLEKISKLTKISIDELKALMIGLKSH